MLTICTAFDLFTVLRLLSQNLSIQSKKANKQRSMFVIIDRILSEWIYRVSKIKYKYGAQNNGDGENWAKGKLKEDQLQILLFFSFRYSVLLMRRVTKE